MVPLVGYGVVSAIIAIGIGIDLLWRAARERHGKAPTMTAADAGFWTTVAATLVCAGYAVLGYHRPPKSPPKASPSLSTEPAAVIAGSRERRLAIPLIAMFAALSAAGFTFVDRHWFTPASSAQMPLAEDDARMEVMLWHFAWNAQNLNQYFANMYTANNGKSDAIGVRSEQMMILSPAVITSEQLGVYYIILKAQFTLKKAMSKSRVHPGGNGIGSIWFSAFSEPQLSDQQKAAVNSGALIPYALSTMQYKDDHISSDEFIYTESCAYHLSDGAIHECDRGSNITYISN
ncbi:MAG: hypothetical protein ACRECV_13770 [Xanthobacteraceae bacterium]